jgi:hypothetical protein
LNENQFGRVQIDRTEEVRNWANKMKEVNQNQKYVEAVIVTAINHYGGYGTGLLISFVRIWIWASYPLKMWILQK